jgi:hypothetical protein
MKKLAIVTTHPIQYNAPLFKLLTDRKNSHQSILHLGKGRGNLTRDLDAPFNGTSRCLKDMITRLYQTMEILVKLFWR